MLCQLLPYGILLQILFADKFGGMCLPGTFIFLLFVFICAETYGSGFIIFLLYQRVETRCYKTSRAYGSSFIFLLIPHNRW